MPSENVALATVFVGIFRKLRWTSMKELGQYGISFPSCFQVRKKHIGRYVLKLENKNGWHGNNFCYFFIKLQIIQLFIGINMLYKFGEYQRKIVAVRELSFWRDRWTEGWTVTVSISPFMLTGYKKIKQFV